MRLLLKTVVANFKGYKGIIAFRYCLSDQKWHSRRKLLTNTFHFKILETYVPALNNHARSLVKNLVRASQNDKPITDIEAHVTLCALDIVCGNY